MKRAMIAGGALAIVLVLLVLAIGRRDRKQGIDPEVDTASAILPSTTSLEDHPGFLYGRITTDDGGTYEGRLRFGGDQEAFWGDYFNGLKDENPWASHVPPEQLKEPDPITFFGIEIANRERQINLSRPFMGRFGDIARIEAQGRDILVTLKSGTVFHLDGYSADDFADGVRVWDAKRGVLDFDEGRIRIIELLPTVRLSATPNRLHGTVHTPQGDFTGFIQWDREKCVGTDELHGRTADGRLNLRFDTIRSIARTSRDSFEVTLVDDRKIVLTGNLGAGDFNRGMYVDDRRYGRVLVSWEAFERIDFSPGGSGPAFADFPPGRSLTGAVTTRAGQRLAGRLVYDLDETETTETLDAPFEGVDFTIPFGLIASIVPAAGEQRGTQRAKVTLHSGEELQLERSGDLGAGNAGILIFIDGRERPEYLRWADVARIDFDRPKSMYPSLGER